jgi:hypothetical protein
MEIDRAREIIRSLAESSRRSPVLGTKTDGRDPASRRNTRHHHASATPQTSRRMYSFAYSLSVLCVESIHRQSVVRPTEPHRSTTGHTTARGA